ncbi:MAG: FAD-dependent oxidoreductase [Rickettsiales bacterium]|jgi:choline dehydrogenase-like flavoprotein|nr:FAD-dependent oxidoreductase [Rickettsiales bacterium]
MSADVCVVGGGAAGIAIAMRLNKTDTNVIMIESGGFEPDKATLDLNKGSSVGLPYSTETTRLRWFGGTTNHWEGMCAPLTDIDFEKRDWIPHSGWPIKRSDLDEGYKWAAKFLNLSGTGTDDFSVPQDIIPNPGTLSFGCWRFAHNLSLGEVYRKTLEESQNVRILLHSNVIDIRLVDELNSVSELKVATLSGARFSVRAKKYILACGGIENARLLLASNSQMQYGIGNGYDQVGRYFMEHPHNDVGTFYSNHTQLNKLFMLDFKRVRGLRAVNTDIVSNGKHAVLNIVSSIKTMESFGVGSGSLVINASSQFTGHIAQTKQLTQIHKIFPYKTYTLFTRTEQVPNPYSRVLLSNLTRDELGVPRISVDWRITEQDWRTIQVLVKKFSETVSSSGQGLVKIADWLSDSYRWPKHTWFGCHHIGTTRMSENPQNGVVDKKFRVYGTNNLFIIGSSVFPTAGSANPTLTVIAISRLL